MKPQASKLKLQGNSKFQAPMKVRARHNPGQNGIYPTLDSGGWVLNEGPKGESAARHPFDLEERTARFGETIIRFAKKIPRGPGNDRLIDQLVGCGTSVGANYREANESNSK